MALFSKSINNMDDLFVHTLQDIYYAENQIVKSLPDMIEKASDPDLKQCLTTHLDQSRNHVKRLETVFRMAGQEPKGTDCPAIDGILEEATDVMSDVSDEKVRDAAMLAAAQAVEHYEISRYGTLITWANELNHPDCAGVLKETISEEKDTDKKLSDIAESRVNLQAEARMRPSQPESRPSL